MPLVAAAVLAYAAGLLAGFADALPLALAISAVAGIASLGRRVPALGGVALAAGAGALVGTAHAADARTCALALIEQRSWRVVLAASASPGTFVTGRARDCDARVALSVERGVAPLGATVLVRGTAVPSLRGLLVDHAALRLVEPPGVLDRWRGHSGARVDALFGGDAPLVRALLIADMRQLSPEIRDRYAAAGLAHMLSISGLHVGIIAYALDLVLRLLRLPRRVVTGATIGIISVYVAAIGAPAPAVRSAMMLGVLELSRMLQRPTSPWAVLAIGAFGPVLTPATVLDLGYQLSVAGVAALIAAGRLARRVLPHDWRGWRRDLARGALASSLATVVSAPLVAWTFGRVSIIGPLTNLAADPVMALAQPMLFATLVVSPWPALARWIADAAHPLLFAFDRIAMWGAAVPFARLEAAPSLAGALLGGVFSVAVVVACVSRWPRRALLAAGSALALVAWLPMVPRGNGMTEVHMLDVGQGDAIAVRTPHGSWLLFDAGRSWAGGDAGRSVIVPYLARRGGTLAAFVLTHPHDDHVGGAATVIRSLHPRRYLDGGLSEPSERYRASLFAAREQHVAWSRIHPGDSLLVDGVRVSFLAPDSAWVAGVTNPNDASAIAVVQVGRVRFLLVGDADAPEEEWVLATGAERLRADVLKVGHHGSRTSSTPAFLDAVQPRLALISVGAGNTYGHPNTSVLEALAARGAQVLRTDLIGTVVVRTDGRHIYVDAHGDTWQLSTSSIP